jgi:hypothetical protein
MSDKAQDGGAALEKRGALERTNAVLEWSAGLPPAGSSASGAAVPEHPR